MAARVSAVSRTAEPPANHRQRLPVGRVAEAVVSVDMATEVCPTLPHVLVAPFYSFRTLISLSVSRTSPFRINAADPFGHVLAFEIPGQILINQCSWILMRFTF